MTSQTNDDVARLITKEPCVLLIEGAVTRSSCEERGRDWRYSVTIRSVMSVHSYSHHRLLHHQLYYYGECYV